MQPVVVILTPALFGCKVPDFAMQLLNEVLSLNSTISPVFDSTNEHLQNLAEDEEPVDGDGDGAAET